MARTKNVPKCPGTRVDVLDPCVEVPVPTGARDTSRTAFQSENFSGSFFSPPCPRTGRDVGLLYSLSKKKYLSQSVHTPGGDRLNPWGEAPVPTGARDTPVSNGSGSFYFSRADGFSTNRAWLAGLQTKILRLCSSFFSPTYFCNVPSTLQPLRLRPRCVHRFFF